MSDIKESEEIKNEEEVEEEAVNENENNEETADSETSADNEPEAEEVSEDAADEEEDSEETDGSDNNNKDGSDDAEAEEKGSLTKDVFEILESTLVTMFVIVMIFTYLAHPLAVQGHSMNDTLQNENKVSVYTLKFTPKRGDIIVINNDAAYLLDENNNVVKKEIAGSQLEECLIKRVIAGPGQTLKIDPDANTVTVDGQVLTENYTKPIPEGEDTMIYGIGWIDGEITIPEGYCFVMGDNRNNSADSRNPSVGLIKEDQIYGKALLRYSPLKDFKILLFND